MEQLVEDFIKNPPPTGEPPKANYVFYPFSSPVSDSVAGNVRGRDFRLLASVELNEQSEGVLFAHGSRFGGHVLYISGGHLIYEYNFLGVKKQRFVSDEKLDSGAQVLGVAFTKKGVGEHRELLGDVELYINDDVVASGPVTVQTGPFSLSGEGQTVGYDGGDSVSDGYMSPGTFTGGTIHSVQVNTSGKPYLDLERDLRQAMAAE